MACLANHNPRRPASRSDRPALVLVLVLVVIMMLALAGFTFAELMLTENKATRLHGNRLQLQQALHSGAEQMKLFFEQPRAARTLAGGAMDNPAVFRAVPLQAERTTLRTTPNQLRFSIVAPAGATVRQPQSGGIRFGVENESGRLHLADLLRYEKQVPGAGRKALMQFPGMTAAAADSILDWIDSDSEPRPMGAENDYYSGLPQPYAVRNGLPECLEELLLVKGVTRELLLGADTNYNRQLEPEEIARRSDAPRRALQASMPWSWLLTIYSGQRNQTAAGKPRININGMNLSRLEQQLNPAVGPQLAAFIVAYRQHGPYMGSDSALRAAPPTRSAQPPRFTIGSVLDLIGAKVSVAAEKAGDKPKVYASPLPAEPQALGERLNKLQDSTTVVDLPVIRGLVSVNHAEASVLQAVPGIDSALAQRIVAARQEGAAGKPTNRQHATWLWFEGLVDLQTMKRLMPYVTGGGDVVRAQIVAHRDQPGPMARAEVIIDATAAPARAIVWRDLQFHGPGYPLEWLMAGSSTAARN